MTSEIALHDADWPTLLRAARAGDSRSLGEVCERLRRRLDVMAERGLGRDLQSKLSASDVVQRSLMEVHCDIQRFQGGSETEFRAWVERIVRHNLIDETRRFRQSQQRSITREVPLGIGDSAHEVADKQRAASSVFRRRETDDQLQRAIAGLSGQRRKVIELRFRHAMGYSEIAQIMNMSESAARKLGARAIDELRRLLATKPVEAPTRSR